MSHSSPHHLFPPLLLVLLGIPTGPKVIGQKLFQHECVCLKIIEDTVLIATVNI